MQQLRGTASGIAPPPPLRAPLRAAPRPLRAPAAGKAGHRAPPPGHHGKREPGGEQPSPGPGGAAAAAAARGQGAAEGEAEGGARRGLGCGRRAGLGGSDSSRGLPAVLIAACFCFFLTHEGKCNFRNESKAQNLLPFQRAEWWFSRGRCGMCTFPA